MSMVTDILERLAGIEIVKERMRDTGARIERLAGHVVELDRKVHDVDRRLVRIETFAEVAGVPRKLPRRD